jgi:hypothetical protein
MTQAFVSNQRNFPMPKVQPEWTKADFMKLVGALVAISTFTFGAGTWTNNLQRDQQALWKEIAQSRTVESSLASTDAKLTALYEETQTRLRDMSLIIHDMVKQQHP